MPVPGKPKAPFLSPRITPNPAQTQVHFEWKPVLTATNFEIRLEEAGTGRRLIESAATPPLRFANLQPGEDYNAFLVAINTEGRSPESDPFPFKTREPRLPDSYMRTKVGYDLEVAYKTSKSSLRVTITDVAPGGIGNADELHLLVKAEGESTSDLLTPFYKFRDEGTFFVIVRGDMDGGGSIDLSLTSFPEWSHTIHWRAAAAESQTFVLRVEVVKEFA